MILKSFGPLGRGLGKLSPRWKGYRKNSAPDRLPNPDTLHPEPFQQETYLLKELIQIDR